MDKLYDFLANNYVIFIIISAFILFVIIGILASGKRKKKDDDPSAQPIKVEFETSRVIDSPLAQSNSTANFSYVEAPVQEKKEEDIIEPSLEAFASTATEVKLSGSMEEIDEPLIDVENTQNSEPTMLVIDDPESKPTTNIQEMPIITEPTSTIENTQSSEPTMLIIEDPESKTTNNKQETSTLEDYENSSMNSGIGMLVIEDPDAKKDETEIAVLEEKEPSTPPVANNEPPKSIFED